MNTKRTEDKYIPTTIEAEYDHYLSTEEEVDEKENEKNIDDDLEERER